MTAPEEMFNLDYEQIIDSCRVNPEVRRICKDPLFWEQKANYDFKRSLRDLSEDNRRRPANEQYLALLTEERVVRGSELVITDPRVLIKRAIEQRRPDLVSYYVQSGSVPIEDAIIASVVDRKILDRLIVDNRIDLTANPDFFYQVYLEALKVRNEELIREFTPIAETLFPEPCQAEEILATVGMSGDIRMIEYVHSYFYLGETQDGLDEWLLYAALTTKDDQRSQELIASLLRKEEYWALSKAFVATGEYSRLVSLLRLIGDDSQTHARIGRYLLIDAAREGNLAVIKLVEQDQYFRRERRRSWFEQAYDVAVECNQEEIMTYLESLLETM